MAGRIVVIGAGLAGLVAAEGASAEGREVILLEASPKVGGRCRSYHDGRLGRRIDNGNHLILSGNRAVLGWADRIGGGDALEMASEAAFPFLDLGSDASWTIRIAPGAGGLLRREARPPGVSLARAGAQAARLMLARRGRSVAGALPDRGPLWRAFWDPMTRAVLNADPAVADAGLLRGAILRSFARGAAACRPVFAPRGLGPALIDPAAALLERRGVRPRLREPVRGLRFEGGRLAAVETRDGEVALGRGDAAILALPPRAAAALLPGLSLPGPGLTIANAHFLVPENALPPLLGLLGGAAQWLFRRGDMVSVTVSAAEASPLEGLGREDALALLWDEVAAAVRHHGGRVPAEMPPARLVREKDATFDQSAAGAARRPGARTAWRNLFLAGDHVATGLPATLEGAVLSGERAAALALAAGVEDGVEVHEPRQQPGERPARAP